MHKYGNGKRTACWCWLSYSFFWEIYMTEYLSEVASCSYTERGDNQEELDVCVHGMMHGALPRDGSQNRFYRLRLA